MSSRMNKPVVGATLLASSLAASLALLTLLGCQDEQIGQLVPKIAICAAEDAVVADCDRDVDLGEVPVTVPLSLSLFLKNPGAGTLDIDGVTSSDTAVALGVVPNDLPPGQAVVLPFTVTLPADGLGARTVTVTVTSDDPEKPSHAIDLLMTGVPKPAPDILVCAVTDGVEECGTDLQLGFGTVRRSQRQGLALVVKNVGTARLAISDVHLEGASSVEGEIVIASSTRPAELAAGATAPLLVVYQPGDDGEDGVDLVVVSDDEDTRAVRIGLRGTAGDNEPPVASAVETLSQQSTAAGIVEDAVQVDASASADPEGDPLQHRWTLVVPAGSAARLDDATAVRASFTPDVAGTYVASAVVADSLGQESAPAAVVITVRPRFGFRAQLVWEGAGDLDLHVIEQGGVLFGARDCSFVARAVDFGAVGVTDDDCLLFDDATGAPGPEQAVIVAPAAGTYEVWAQLFDGGEAGVASAVTATVKVIIDDAAEPILAESLPLPTSPACATWHVADVTFSAVANESPTVVIIEPTTGAACP